MILGNCVGLFQGTQNGSPQVHFCEQASIWLKQVQIGHEEKKIMELNNSPKYIELQNSQEFLEWLECKVKNVTSNLPKWFEVFYLAKGQGKLTCGGGEIMG